VDYLLRDYVCDNCGTLPNDEKPGGWVMIFQDQMKMMDRNQNQI